MKFVRGLLISSVLLGVAACSGDGQEEPTEPVEAEGGGEEAAAEEGAAEEAPAGEADDKAAAEAAPAEPAPAAAAPAAPAAAEPAGFDGAAATRWVTSYALNVRSAPDKTAPVLRHVKWGDKVSVVINGEWAKIGNGEYISAKYLSATDPAAKGKGKAAKKKGKK